MSTPRAASTTDPETSTGRGHWSSRMGFVLAAAGSAIGLGNLWKFPYIAWTNEGGAFVIVYLLAVVSVGLPIMIAELLLGRRAQTSAAGALGKCLGPGWSWVGGLGVVTGALILSAYAVIAGWTLRYIVVCWRWTTRGFVSSESSGAAFATFTANGPLQVLLVTLFMAATMAVVLRGIGGGIEKVAKILMPVLFAILLLMLVSALQMGGAREALGYIFTPDFSKLPARGALEALGHAFFSLSLGMGAMIAYGSYLGKNESIVRSATLVVLLDTLIALVAAVIMFSVIFSVPGMREQVGGSVVGMLFIVLPELFYTAVPFGNILAPLFYVFVAFAALTSTVSLLEVAVSHAIDQWGLSRRGSVLLCGGLILVIASMCGLSLGGWGPVSNFSLVHAGTAQAKSGLFAHLDHLTSNWLLSIGGLLITVGVGWFMSRRVTESELMDDNTPAWFHYGLWRFFVRYVAPVSVAAILVAVILGMDFS